MRIYKDRFYVISVVPGLSGFQRWNEREHMLVTGLRAKRNDYREVREVKSLSGSFELNDGHLPGHRPVVDFAAACEWLTQNPYQEAVVL